LAAAAAAAAAVASSPMAAAAPNANGTEHANPNAPGISVASVAGTGPSTVLTAVQGIAPAQAQTGLATAVSHLPTP
jgi:hypothetical protein